MDIDEGRTLAALFPFSANNADKPSREGGGPSPDRGGGGEGADIVTRLQRCPRSLADANRRTFDDRLVEYDQTRALCLISLMDPMTTKSKKPVQ